VFYFIVLLFWLFTVPRKITPPAHQSYKHVKQCLAIAKSNPLAEDTQLTSIICKSCELSVVLDTRRKYDLEKRERHKTERCSRRSDSGEWRYLHVFLTWLSFDLFDSNICYGLNFADSKKFYL